MYRYSNSQRKSTEQNQGFIPIYRLDNEKMAFLNVSRDFEFFEFWVEIWFRVQFMNGSKVLECIELLSNLLNM